MNSAAEIAKLVGVMATAYPNIQVTPETIRTYVTMLSDIPVKLLEAAIQQAVAESEFFPTVARLRDKALALSCPHRISAFEAWGLVKKEIERSGFYRSPTFDDAAITKAVECIGWRTLCCSENEPADRAHFAKVYESLIRRDQEDAKILPSVRALTRAALPLMIQAAGNH